MLLHLPPLLRLTTLYQIRDNLFVFFLAGHDTSSSVVRTPFSSTRKKTRRVSPHAPLP